MLRKTECAFVEASAHSSVKNMYVKEAARVGLYDGNELPQVVLPLLAIPSTRKHVVDN